MLSVQILLDVLDGLAVEIAMVDDAFGVDAVAEPGTIFGLASAIRDTLAAINDHTVQTDLTPIFARRAVLLQARNVYPVLAGSMIGRALDVHYGGSGGLNGFLKANDARVHPNVRLLGIQIDSRNVFLPTALDPVARYEGTGAGTGTFMAGSDIDPNEFGEAAFELVSEDIGAIPRTLRLTLKNFDGTTENRDVVIAGGTAANTVFPVGAVGERFVGVANIATVGAGGTAGDSFRVRTVVERDIFAP